eukprot:2295884-Rhodomonas_salina.1
MGDRTAIKPFLIRGVADSAALVSPLNISSTEERVICCSCNAAAVAEEKKENRRGWGAWRVPKGPIRPDSVMRKILEDQRRPERGSLR